MWAVVFTIIVLMISFARSFLGLIGAIPWHYGYSDVFNEDRIGIEAAKKIPYLETPIEYPLITGLFIYAMWFLGRSLLGYAALTWLFLTVFAVVTAIALHKLCGLLNVGKKRIFWFYIFAPSLVFFGVYNWDIIAVMLMVLAVYFFYRHQHAWAAVFLGLGFNAKLFPVILLPIMLLKSGLRQGVKIALVFLLTFLVLNIYFIANSFDVWKETYSFHSSREPNIDSAWALTVLGTSAINTLSAVLFLLFYSALIFYHKKHDFPALGFASLILFLLFNKVFSPQYVLWILPFFVLSSNISKKLFYSLEATNLIVFFSTSYFILASKGYVFLAASHISVIARSLLLAYLLYIILAKSASSDIAILKTTKTNI